MDTPGFSERPSNLVPSSVRKLLLHWSNDAASRAAMHDMSWMYFRNWNLLTMISGMIMISASSISTLGIGRVQGVSCETASVVTISFSICSILGSLVIAINRFVGYAELQQQHDFFADSYDVLHRDILSNLIVNNTAASVFVSDAEFMKHCKIQLDTLIDRAPAIPFAVRAQASSAKRGVWRGGACQRSSPPPANTSCSGAADVPANADSPV
jgi:hypothetical protein